jgi:hypothetical protein
MGESIDFEWADNKLLYGLYVKYVRLSIAIVGDVTSYILKPVSEPGYFVAS